MFFRAKSGLLGCVLLAFTLLLAACDSTGGQQAAATDGQQATATSIITTTVVTPKVVSATTVPGGKPNSEEVVLSDRILLINSVSKQQGASQSFRFINLDLTVQNTGKSAIQNLSTFFRLVGPGGDTSGYQYNSSDNFYGPIATRTSRSGTIMFQLPPATTSSLRLLYRPEITTEAVIILLKVS